MALKRIIISGRVGIGTLEPSHNLTVIGDINATRNVLVGGNITSYGADFAEMMPSNELLEPGDVVCFTNADFGMRNAELSIVKCASHGNKAIAGIVSAKPTIIGNSHVKGYAVGIAGLVKAKVKGPIERFDLLTSSDLEGYAEKATLGDFGAIIGKALEACEEDVCEIEVLVSHS